MATFILVTSKSGQPLNKTQIELTVLLFNTLTGYVDCSYCGLNFLVQVAVVTSLTTWAQLCGQKWICSWPCPIKVFFCLSSSSFSPLHGVRVQIRGQDSARECKQKSLRMRLWYSCCTVSRVYTPQPFLGAAYD